MRTICPENAATIGPHSELYLPAQQASIDALFDACRRTNIICTTPGDWPSDKVSAADKSKEPAKTLSNED